MYVYTLSVYAYTCWQFSKIEIDHCEHLVCASMMQNTWRGEGFTLWVDVLSKPGIGNSTFGLNFPLFNVLVEVI